MGQYLSLISGGFLAPLQLQFCLKTAQFRDLHDSVLMTLFSIPFIYVGTYSFIILILLLLFSFHGLQLFFFTDMGLGVQEKSQPQPTMECVVLVWPIMQELEASESIPFIFLIKHNE